MPRFQFHALFAGATAIALVMTGPAHAQQEGQAEETQAQQQDQTQAEVTVQQTPGEVLRYEIQNWLISAEQALEADEHETALVAVQEAAEAVTRAEELLDDPNETLDRLAGNLEEARIALETDAHEVARAGIQSAQVALDAVSQFTWAMTAGEPEIEAAAPARQPVPALEEAELDLSTLIEDRLQAAEQALEAGNTDEALSAVGAAAEAVNKVEQALPDRDELVDRLAGNIEEARISLEQDAAEVARAGIQSAQLTLESIEDWVWAMADEPGQRAQQQEGQAAEIEPQAAAEIKETADAAEGRQPIPQGAEETAGGQQDQQQVADQQDQEGEQQQAEGQQPGPDVEVTVVEGDAAAPDAGQTGGAVIEAEVVEAEAETVVVDEQPAAAETVTGQEAQAGFEAEVVRGDQLTVEQTNQLLGIGDQPIEPPAEMLSVAPADIQGRDVVSFEGDSIGEVEDIVLSGGEAHAIIAHGGFLGIGRNRVAIPASRLGMRGEEIVLLGLSEEQLDAMPEFDFETGEIVPEGQTLDLGVYE